MPDNSKSLEMDRTQIQFLIQEEVERAMYPCSFLISYDIKDNDLRSKVHDAIVTMCGIEKNESLYCFSGADGIRLNVLAKIREILQTGRPTEGDTVVYCITADAKKMMFSRISSNTDEHGPE